MLQELVSKIFPVSKSFSPNDYNYLFTNNYEYERYQDTCQDRWDNGGSEELGEIDFTNAEELMQYIMEYK